MRTRPRFSVKGPEGPSLIFTPIEAPSVSMPMFWCIKDRNMPSSFSGSTFAIKSTKSPAALMPSCGWAAWHAFPIEVILILSADFSKSNLPLGICSAVALSFSRRPPVSSTTASAIPGTAFTTVPAVKLRTTGEGLPALLILTRSIPFSRLHTPYSLSGVNAISGIGSLLKYISRSLLAISSPAPKMTRTFRFPVTPASLSALRQYNATTAAPLSSAVPRPKYKFPRLVRLKGSVFQPSPAGTTST